MNFQVFLNYGQNPQTIHDEVSKELQMLLEQAASTQFSDRTKGLGLDYLENEMVTVEELLNLNLSIMYAVSDYNTRVAEDRQVVVSQDWIKTDMTASQTGESFLKIELGYILKSALVASTQTNIQTVVSGGG